MGTHKDKIRGGLADKRKPSDFNKKELAMGIAHEMEHTKDRAVAQEIAMDHLAEDSRYYTNLKAVEKGDRVEITADGKRELDVGVEPLDKNPTKELKKRWKDIKKSLDSSVAIMDLAGQEFNPDEEEEQEPAPEADEPAPEDNQQAEAAPDAQEETSEGDSSSEEGEVEELTQLLADEGYSETEIAHILHGHIPAVPTEDDYATHNEKRQGEVKHQIMEDEHKQKSAQADEEHKHELEHKRRMSDVEYEKAKSEVADPETEKSHRKRMLDLEYEVEQGKKHQASLDVEHKKRMLDLEFEMARKEADKEDPTEAMKRQQMEFELQMKRMEKELELEFKKKELALKLKITEESARQKAEHQAKQAEEDAKTNAVVKKEQAKHKVADAKKPPAKENTSGSAGKN